jgi:large subunit ribosomal protein L25
MQAIKRFRARELLGLVNHLKHFGPLPEPTNSNTTTNQPTIQLPNPFLPKFNPKSGKWHKPNYSLRRQAELVKKAHATGSMDLLPPGPKKAAFESRMQRVAAATATATATATAKPAPPSPSAPTRRNGKWDVIEWVGKVPEKKVVGAELGIRLYAGKKRMFRGHLWERVRAKRIRRRTILMRDMAARVENYKTVCVFCITSLTAFVNCHPSTTRRGNQTRSNRQDIQNPPSYHSKVNLHWLYLRSVRHHEPSNQLKSWCRATKTFIYFNLSYL